MRILVQKFGGSSVADLECMKKVRGKVLAAREEIRDKKMQDVQKELRRAFLRVGLLKKDEP